ncbi:ABC transporter substrate-binding protein [Nocardioides sp. BGMRC 2183]|nr:ABC transporter substrate-binding protein [Nocardioides sp. BGMRC 2183]
MRKSFRTSLALLVVPGLLFAACSSDDGDKDGSDSAAATGIPDNATIINAVETDEAVASKVPADIAEDGTLTVGNYSQFPPNMFIAEDGETVIGLDNDIMRAIVKKLGLELDYREMEFPALITSLQSGRVESTISAMFDNAERQQAIDFVDYLTTGIALMVQKGNPADVSGPEDLCGRPVATTTGTSQQKWAEALSEECVAQGEEAIDLRVTDSDSTNWNQLRTGRVDVLLQSSLTASYLVKTVDDGTAFEVVDIPPIDGAPIGIGINKQNPELRDAIAEALNALIADGTYAEILAAWGNEAGALEIATVNGGN